MPATVLKVEASPVPLPSAVELTLQAPQTNLYVGEAVRVRVLLPAASDAQPLIPAQAPPVQVTGEGFMLDPGSLRQVSEVRTGSAGVNSVSVVAYEMTLTPITAGSLSAFAQSYVASRLSITFISTNGSVVISPGSPQYTLLDSAPVEFRIRPLPRRGELPGFTGMVGSFKLDPPALTTNALRAGDAIKLTVKVRGTGHLEHLVGPPPPKLREWQVFASPADTQAPQTVQSQGFITLGYTLIPLTEQVQATPAIPFSCFDPARGVYVDLTIPPVPVKVQPASAPTDFQAVQQANSSEEKPEKEPVLSDLALSPGLAFGGLVPLQQRSWFPLVQLAPGVAFLGLWGWARRQRFLEQHPEVLLRRRARRELRREWRTLNQAARAGDAAAFVSSAVSAMRIACAPHYPAEPRALVCSDVLGALPGTDEQTGGMVRRLFTIADASNYAAAPTDATELLAFQGQVEQLLERLEERL